MLTECYSLYIFAKSEVEYLFASRAPTNVYYFLNFF